MKDIIVKPNNNNNNNNNNKHPKVNITQPKETYLDKYYSKEFLKLYFA
jgi:hypothetical protein